MCQDCKIAAQEKIFKFLVLDTFKIRYVKLRKGNK
jgi:hypothetical protein